MIGLTDRDASSGMGGCERGMNTLDPALSLRNGECSLLENLLPGDPPTPRNGIVDLFYESTARGQGSEHTTYLPGAVHTWGPDGKEYIFAWSRNVTTTTRLNLEVINKTDGSRSVLTSMTFATATAHVSMLKIYNSIYCLFDDTISTNHTHAYLTRNIVVYHNGSTWALRAWGIDKAPSCGAVTFGEDEGYGFPIALTSHSCLVYKNSLWIIGGSDAFTTYSQKIFRSDDGKSWNEVGTNSLPLPLAGHGAIVFAGKMWIFGGITTNGVYQNRIYYSSDGLTWTQHAIALPSDCGVAQIVPISNGVLTWIICGRKADDTPSYKIYRMDLASDGMDWGFVGNGSGFPYDYPSTGLSCLYFSGKMWAFGTINSEARACYSSDGGENWAEAGTNVFGVTDLDLSAACIHYGKMWVSGGYTSSGTYNKVWYSSDGISWTEAGSNSFPIGAAGSPGLAHSMTSFAGKLLVIGGSVGFTAYKTVYASSDGITWVQQKVNAIAQNKYVTVAFSFVRLSDTVYHKYFLTPIDSSITNTDYRQTVLMESVGVYGVLLVRMPSSEMILDARGQGATHLRIWRTLGADSAIVAQGLSLKYCEDIPLSGGSYGAAYVHHSQVTDTQIALQSVAIDVVGYEVSPKGRFAAWDKERLWLSAGDGFWQYSVGASTDVEFPQVYASLFSAHTQSVLFDPEDGDDDTGAKIFFGDLYFWKRNKIGVLDQANPDNTPRTISGMGCDFPSSLCEIDHPKLGKCIFFLTNKEPVILAAGGSVSGLDMCRHAGLWNKGLVHVDPATNLVRTSEWKERVCASWFRNALRVLVPGEAIPTVYGFYATTDGKYVGGFLDTPAIKPAVVSPPSAAAYLNDPACLLPIDGNICYSLSHKSNVYRLSQYAKIATFRDTFSGVAYSYTGKIKSRPLGLDSNFSVMAELSDVLIYCMLKDSGAWDFTIYSESTRFRYPIAYVETVDSDLASAGYNYFRDQIQLFPEEGFYGKWFEFLSSHVIPSDGNWEQRGIKLNVQPMQEFGPEFYTSVAEGARVNGWS